MDVIPLNWLAKHVPNALIEISECKDISPGMLSRVAEAIGRIRDPKIATPALLRLLSHSDRCVREGAVYGASHHITDEIFKRLEEMVKYEQSPGVREAVVEALEDI